MIESELKQKVNFCNKVGKYNVSSEAFVDFIFTEKCNCNCKFCIANTKSRAIDNLEAWKRNTKAMFRTFDIHDIIILGGESTIDPKFFEKVNYIGQVMDKKKRNIILTTNGVMLRNPKFLEKLCNTVITTVNISYMNHNKEKNDSIMRGNTLTVDELREVRRVLNSHGMTLRLNSNVFRGNCDTVEEMLEYINTLKDVSDAIKFSPLISTESFNSEDDVSLFTNTNSMSQSEINNLYNDFCNCGTVVGTNDKVFGYVEYKVVDVHDSTVILKYSQLSEMFDRTKEVANLKMYPNGNLSNIWDSRDSSLNSLLNVDDTEDELEVVS